MWTIVKPNGEKIAMLDDAEAFAEAERLSKAVGQNEVRLLRADFHEDEDEKPGVEQVKKVWVYKAGAVISETDVDYEAADEVVAPGKTRSGKKAMTEEEKAAKEAEKAAKKAAKDADKAAKAEERAAAKALRDEERAKRKAEREALKANRPERGPRSKLPDEAIIALQVKENPKRVGSAARPRFDLYTEGMTVKAYKEANPNFGSIDLAWDLEHGFIKVTNADGSELAKPEVVVPPAEEVPVAEQTAEQPAAAQ